MADQIFVTPEELRNTSTSIEKINEDLTATLEKISNEVANLENTWESRGGDEIRSAMFAFKPKFEEYKEIIADYCKFLNDSATTYETTESTIATNASQFK